MARSRPKKFVPVVARLRDLRPDVPNPEESVAAGRVLADGRVVTNPRALVRADAAVVWRPPRRLRGTVKLEAALTTFAVNVRGRVALDVGAAAGGFTAALLEAGAARVYAVEAGHGQLAGWLRQDARVANLERTNLAELDTRLVPETVEVVVLDLSYLALSRAAGQLEGLRIHPAAELVALVKPMYELGRASPPDLPEDLARACRRATRGIEGAGWSVRAVIPSPVPGGRGAREFLLHGRRRRGDWRSASGLRLER